MSIPISISQAPNVTGALFPTGMIRASDDVGKIPAVVASAHPAYSKQELNWQKWRFVYESGDDFVYEYLVKFSSREDDSSFRKRRSLTPIPAFAKGNINEIKNSIFQRMVDVTREGGPITYSAAIDGRMSGVDLEGATMNWFIGNYVLPELLTMKKVGVYVDNEFIGPTLADKGSKHPYFYVYKTEDIRNWSYKTTGDRREFQMILLRDRVMELDSLGFPIREVDRYRRLFINDMGYVSVEFYNTAGVKTDAYDLRIRKIPFVVFEISDSLLKDVANHQIALLNLESSDVSYVLTANFPFYTEKSDGMSSAKIRKAQEAYAENISANPNVPCLVPSDAIATENDILVGSTRGRRYSSERPGFINPSTDPLRASMEKQQQLKLDARALVHLAVSNLQPKMASAESKGFDNQGLEAGLSYIGLELEHGENQLAVLWSIYEGAKEQAIVHYPKKYSLKSSAEVQTQIDQLRKLRDETPSLSAKKAINEQLIEISLDVELTPDEMDTISQEINDSPVQNTDSLTLVQDITAGLVSPATASISRGYPSTEVDLAATAHAERAVRILAAQTSVSQQQQTNQQNDLLNQGQARGVNDLGANPAASKIEKQNKPQKGPNAR